MRSDSEHVHDWARSLVDYSEKTRDDVAWQRTRQIEALARFAYTRIMLDDKIRTQDENVLEKLLEENRRRGALWLGVSAQQCGSALPNGN